MAFFKTTLELSVLLQKPFHLLVLVCEYLKSTHGFVPSYSRGHTMKRTTGGRAAGRLRQLGSSPIVSIAYDPEDGASPTPPLLLRIPLLEVVLRTGS